MPRIILVQATETQSQVRPWWAAAALASRHSRWKSDLSNRPLPPHSSYRLLMVLRDGLGGEGLVAAALGTVFGRHVLGRDERVALCVLQRHRMHRVDLGHRLRVAGHLIVSPSSTLLVLERSRSSYAARKPRAAPMAGAAMAAVKLPDEMAPYIGWALTCAARARAIFDVFVRDGASLGNEDVIDHDGLAARALEPDGVPVVDDLEVLARDQQPAPLGRCVAPRA